MSAVYVCICPLNGKSWPIIVAVVADQTNYDFVLLVGVMCSSTPEIP